LWRWYWDVHGRRQYGATTTPAPLTWAELEAWQRWRQIELTADDKAVIEQMDVALVTTWAQLAEQERAAENDRDR